MTEPVGSSDRPASDSNTAASIGLSESFLEILVCPIDHSHLNVIPGGLQCEKCSRIYPVENGIPNFVIDN